MTFWKITKKDLRLLARDKRTLFGLVALPLFFITILGISAGQLFTAKEKAKRVRVGVVNEDTSSLSSNLIGDVLKLDALEVTGDRFDVTGRNVAGPAGCHGRADRFASDRLQHLSGADHGRHERLPHAAELAA